MLNAVVVVVDVALVVVGAHVLQPLLQVVVAGRHRVRRLVDQLRRVVLQVLQAQPQIHTRLRLRRSCSCWCRLVSGLVGGGWRRFHALLPEQKLLLLERLLVS